MAVVLMSAPSIGLLPSSPRHASIISIDPAQSHRNEVVVLCRLPRDFLNAWPAEGCLVNLSSLVSPQFGRLARFTRRVIFKQLLHAYTFNNPPVPAEQAAIAAPVPKAPPQTHALVPAEDDLAAHLADREVEQGIVARLAGQTGAAADHFRCAGRLGGITPLRAPAEGAEECLRPCRGRGAAWWAGGRLSITG